MEPALLPLLLSSSLFLCTLAAAASSDADVVLDTDGDEVKRGTGYYILPINETHGGLSYRPRNPQEYRQCPVMNVLSNGKGLPVMFDLRRFRGEPVTLGTDVTVAFNVATTCMRSTGWVLGPTDPVTHRNYVLVPLGGEFPYSPLFRIERLQQRHGGGYKLAVCPPPGAAGGYISSAGNRLCGDLGLFSEDGVGWLGLAGSPFPVVFKKVHDITIDA